MGVLVWAVKRVYEELTEDILGSECSLVSHFLVGVDIVS